MNDKLIHLNIFTNTNANRDYFPYIKEAYDGFVKYFGQRTTTIWLDPHPNEDPVFLEEYKKNIETLLPGIEIKMTQSHREGWMRGILESDCEYVFQLEHDFVLQRIKHTAEQITDVMREDNLVYMQFRKAPNNKYRPSEMPWGHLEAMDSKGQPIKGEPVANLNTTHNLEYFTTLTAPNQPQIINRQVYKDFVIPYLKEMNKNNDKDQWKGRGGIERYMIFLKKKCQGLKDSNYKLAVYGNWHHRSSSYHLDARKDEDKIKPLDEPWKPSWEYTHPGDREE